MKRIPKILTWALLLLVMGLFLSSPALGAYKIGVLAKRGADKALTKWRPTAAYLSKKIGTQVTIVPLKFVEIEPAIQARQIDFLLANSSFYAVAKKKFGVKAILTLMNERQGHSLHEFGGVLLSRKDSGITSISQMVGRRFMCVKYSSFGGAQMAWRLLLQNNIDPQTDLASFTEGKTHDNVVKAVQNGLTDVGTVRTDTLERMQGEGLIQLSNFNIIGRINDAFPFVRSTRLYPEWPLGVLPHVDKKGTKALAKALKLMPVEHEANKAAKIVGWTYAADYSPVTECLQEIGYGPFKKK
ncbi:MAG: phosphate/phosphite/phosphonate ABC transporter substrate-binding protein [Thermodesulfobacteriota bacterium]